MSYIPFSESDLFFSDADPELPYEEDYDKRLIEEHRRTGQEIIGVGWGQRKLALGEAYFLLEYAAGITHVVYAGAAPGDHLEFLHLLFPHLVFHLYDTERCHAPLAPWAVIYPQLFTDADAELWRAVGSQIVFISDIRSPISRRMEINVHERVILNDLLTQKRWVEIMRPAATSLKFRTPYLAGDEKIERFTYFDGALFKQPWRPITSSEVRLFFRAIRFRDYDVNKFSDQSYYHNVRVRSVRDRYLNPITQRAEPIWGTELLNDYNSTAEAWILMKALRRLGLEPNSENVQKLSRTLTIIINQKKPFKAWRTLTRLRRYPERFLFLEE